MDGMMLAEISRRLVRLHKEWYGHGPAKARSYLSGDMLVTLLEGSYMPMERTLRESGRGDLVTETRDALHEVFRERFAGTVEEVTGRPVVAFMSANDETELAAEIFLLGPDEPDLGSEEDALRGWSEQAREGDS